MMSAILPSVPWDPIPLLCTDLPNLLNAIVVAPPPNHHTPAQQANPIADICSLYSRPPSYSHSPTLWWPGDSDLPGGSFSRCRLRHPRLWDSYSLSSTRCRYPTSTRRDSSCTCAPV